MCFMRIIGVFICFILVLIAVYAQGPPPIKYTCFFQYSDGGETKIGSGIIMAPGYMTEYDVIARCLERESIKKLTGVNIFWVTEEVDDDMPRLIFDGPLR